MKKRLASMCAALALLLPAMAAEAPLRAQATGVNQGIGLNLNAEPEQQQPDLSLDGIATAPFRILEEARRPQVLHQVRIRQRVIIRVSPSPPDARERLLSSLPRRATRNAYEEVPYEDCVEVEDIRGVQPTQDNRLLLFMDNRQVLAASLDRTCTARAFYSGFYVERNEDGKLCIARDLLQSRAGVSCAVEGLTRLVAVGA